MVKTSVLRVFIPGVDGGVMASPDFGRSLSQPTEGILCPPNSTGTPGFSDLPTALLYKFAYNVYLLTYILKF